MATTETVQRPRTRPSLQRAAIGALGWIVALLFLLPLWWTVVSALRPQAETFRTLSPVTGWTVIPKHLTFHNFSRLFDGNFGRAMLNSIVVTAATLIIGLAICCTAAFALAVLNFPGRSAIFALMVVSFLIPFDAIAIPLT